MATEQSTRFFSLIRREMQEYKTSLFWTPIVTAGVLATLMLVSVLLSDRITILGDAMVQVMMQEESVSGMSIRISIDDDLDVSGIAESNGTQGSDATDPDATEPTWTIEDEPGPVNEEEWNFSREWQFSPQNTPPLSSGGGERVQSFNPVLSVLHTLLLMVLVVVTVNYLLGSLFNDRKDRSILFWKSMPVSEWEEVLAKLAVALVLAPAIFIAVSLLLQLVYVLLGMLLAYRMDLHPVETVFDKINFGSLLVDQIGGWLLTALWVAPLYAWLLLSSAAARRSPFLFAVAPVLGLVVLEQIFLGSTTVGDAILNHVPHYLGGGSAVGFYLDGPDWARQDWLGMCLGLLFAVAALWGAVYLRRFRFEL
jgi:hypothetical protein